MKINFRIYYILLFSAITLSCSNDKSEDISEICSIQITKSIITSPDWLVNKILAITSRVSNFVPIEVYSYSVNEGIYISIIDATNSSIAQAYQFFTCEGNEIEYNSTIYQSLYENYTNNLFRLIWKN